MSKQLMKGNEALIRSAILSGCRAFYGYPITPASEIAEAAALYMPQAGGVFLQAESEVAAINMLYGASSAGVRCMTASSGPGISLMQEGISYMAGRGTALRHRRHHPRRPRPGQHRRRAERLSPGGERRRQRQLSHPRPGAVFGAGDGRPYRAGLRTGRPLSQSGGRAGRRLRRADDGAGRVSRARHPAAVRRTGRFRATPRRAAT